MPRKAPPALPLAATDKDPRSWLKSRKDVRAGRTGPQAPSGDGVKLPTLSGGTQSCARTTVVQNKLCAVAYPQSKTGFRDPRDQCNRTDKRYGGNFRQFQSETQRSYLPIEARPLQFREDGQPISAQRVPGTSLMSPKPPRPWELVQHKAGKVKGVHTHHPLGNVPRDPRFYRSVSSLVFTKPPRLVEQPNPEIAAMQSRLAHKRIGLLE